MKINYTAFAIISALLFILAAGFASAQLGQSAGPLAFGDIPRGGQETLSYGVLNTGDGPIEVNIELQDDIYKIATVEPKQAVIPAGSYIPVYVTVHMPRDAEPGKRYGGHVLVKESAGTGKNFGVGIGFNVALIKSIDTTAGEEFAPPPKPEPPKPWEPPYFAIFILSIMGLLFLYRDPFGWRKEKRKK